MNDEEWQRHLALRELLAWASRRRPDPGDWLDTLLLAYRAGGRLDAVQTRGELLALLQDDAFCASENFDAFSTPRSQGNQAPKTLIPNAPILRVRTTMTPARSNADATIAEERPAKGAT
jgi:hypothetical protein